MKRFFPAIPRFSMAKETSIEDLGEVNHRGVHTETSTEFQENVELEPLEADPDKRKQIKEYHPNLQDDVRKAYLIKGPNSCRGHKYPKSLKSEGARERACVKTWFEEYDWLEYSISKDAVFCLPCYLFKDVVTSNGDFIETGYDGWGRKSRLDTHVGDFDSPHNDAVNKCKALMNPQQSIIASMTKQTAQSKLDYEIRLKASLEAVKYLLKGGIAFRGHDESEDSTYKGPFLELLEVFKRLNSDMARCVQGKFNRNCLMTSPKIQKDLANACAFETTKKIIEDLGVDVFGVLVDESGDCADKEQMALVLRYVDDKGCLLERFLGISHVKETNAVSLKVALENLLSPYGLCISRIRGQGYDGASNMRGHLGGLKALIQEENPSAYYVHCFAHQLQLALVASIKCHTDVSRFFYVVNQVVNLIRSSNKRQELLRDKQAIHIAKIIEQGLVDTGKGLNQESSIVRAGDTRWGSHFRTLCTLMKLFGSIIEVLQHLEDDKSWDKNGEAGPLLDLMQSFDFIFMLYLLVDILGVTNDLNLVLQRRDQDLLNALALIRTCKYRLEEMRASGWEKLLGRVVSICREFDIDVPDMDKPYSSGMRQGRKPSHVSNLHHYKNDCLLHCLDVLLNELNDRFGMENSELLRCVASLSPSSSFSAFDDQLLARMVELYPNDFTNVNEVEMYNQFQNYIHDVRSDPDFSTLSGLADLSRQLVLSRKHKVYFFVYKLLKLALILPVATASVERVFSAMNFVKNELRSRMGDQWLNDCLVTSKLQA